MPHPARLPLRALFTLLMAACAAAHGQARLADDACRDVGTGTPERPVAVLVDGTHRLRLGPIELGVVSPPAVDAAAASAPAPGLAAAVSDTGFHVLVAPVSAQPDSVPDAPRAVQLIEEPSACPGSRSFRVVLAWGSTTPAQAAAARTPGRFVLPLPDFTFATRDEHDHGSRALYAFDARVIGEVAAAP
ncbi:MAG TPA: hypothetical protein VF453_13735 [Burkholderiaceae bacterium]